MMDWINIKDKRPEPGKIVLLYSPVDGMGLGQLNPNKNFYWLYKKVNGDKTVYIATHWAEVEPPEKWQMTDGVERRKFIQ